MIPSQVEETEAQGDVQRVAQFLLLVNSMIGCGPGPGPFDKEPASCSSLSGRLCICFEVGSGNCGKKNTYFLSSNLEYFVAKF